MIVEALLSVFFSFCKFLVSLLPSMAQIPNWVNSAINWIGWGLCFFPEDCWTVCIANITAWILIHWGWALIEWIYKKIPGVD